MIDRKLIFDAAKRRGAVFRTRADVADMDEAIDAAFAPTPAPTATDTHTIGPDGRALVKSFEGCVLSAYPDPGSKNGEPWTIGFGATGPGISKGVVWTQEQADARFDEDIDAFAAKVWDMVKDVPTTQYQLDALTSLGYNIGLGSLQRSTVMRLHRAGDYKGAARAFLMWNKNDGKVMRGLTRRRMAESDLYLKEN